jgi:CheY-like chemotaxis protein
MTHRLLLADDSVTIQRVIELTFADEDVEVIAVGDGQMAIDRLDSDPPDIVLADVDMPKRDGYEVAAYVKSRPKLAHIPVVLLTGAFEPVDEARAAEAGSSDVLAKPFEPQMVINRVKQLLGKKREETPAAPPQAQSAQPTAPRPPARSSMPMRDDHASTPDRPNAPEAGQQPVSLDDYFDQLDAAFSDLQTVAAAPDHEVPSHEEDWIDSLPEPVLAPLAPPPAAPTQPAPRPVAAAPSFPPPPAATAAPPPAAAPAAPSHPVAAHPQQQTPEHLIAPPPPGPPPANPAWAPLTPVATAPPPAPPRQPVPAPLTPPAAAPVITNEVIEEVVARVLQRMSDRVIRETVSEIVSKSAERAVQEEILRIKAEAQ